MRNLESRITSAADAEYFARRRLPRSIYQLFENRSGSGQTVRDNLAAFEAVRFRPRAAVFNEGRDLKANLLQQDLSLPVILSSIGLLGLGHPDGEAGIARAAGAAGTAQVVSGVTYTPIEKIVAASSGPVFFQLYYSGGRDASAQIIQRAKDAGCAGLVITVDSAAPLIPERPYKERSYVPTSRSLGALFRFMPQALARPKWMWSFLRGGADPRLAMILGEDGSPLPVWQGIGTLYQQTPAWEDLSWIRERWDGQLIVKGVLSARDAEQALENGADAVVVSNHGGNALDGSLPSLAVLPEVVDAVGDRIEVLMDSGVRSGADVVKALALGARGVLIGRAYVDPFLAAGEPGVLHMLEIFRRQIGDTLAFLGCSSVSELDRSYVDYPAAGEQWV